VRLRLVSLCSAANRLGEKVTIYTNGDESVLTGLKIALAVYMPTSKTRKNVSIESREIVKFVKGARNAEIEVFFEGGEKKIEGFLVHKRLTRLNGNWVEQLGLEVTEQGDIKVTPPLNETSVHGVFAAGDCGLPLKAFTEGIASGPLVAAGLAGQLQAED
jgi:pyruvate/2-oxoglutarate dehydrogenase complex dihydrolipoamide dehydrogenase (E3) component